MDDIRVRTSLTAEQVRAHESLRRAEQRRAHRPRCTRCDDTGRLSTIPVHDDRNPWASRTVWCDCPAGQEHTNEPQDS